MDLNFEEHISTKVKKANLIMGLIRRSFSFLDCHLFKTLSTTFVRQHTEYAQAVWTPHLLKHINIIEKVQKRATQNLEGLSNLPYNERLQKLYLPTFVFRRTRWDMIQIYKHFHDDDKDSLSYEIALVGSMFPAACSQTSLIRTSLIRIFVFRPYILGTNAHCRFCNLLLSRLSWPFIPAPDVNYPVFPD